MRATTHPRRLARLKRALNRKLDEQALGAQPNNSRDETEEKRQKRLAAEIATLEQRVDRNGRTA
jgi:hypothetical protein